MSDYNQHRHPNEITQRAIASDEIDLVSLLSTVLTHWRVIALFIFLAAVSSVLIAFFWMTPIFRSEIVLAPTSMQESSGVRALGQLGGLAALAGVSVGADNQAEEAIAFLESKKFTRQFVEENNLTPILFYKKWDSVQHKWNVKNEKAIPSDEDVYKLFNEKVRKVKKDIKTGLITLSIEWEDPHLAAQWANGMIFRLNETLRERAIIDSKKRIEFLKFELTKTNSVEVKESIYHLIEAQTKESMLANVSEEYAFRVIDPAVPPVRKAKPKRALICVAGTFLGGLLGVFFVFSREFYVNQLRPNLKV